jgi:hypothetical protein
MPLSAERLAAPVTREETDFAVGAFVRANQFIASS